MAVGGQLLGNKELSLFHETSKHLYYSMDCVGEADQTGQKEYALPPCFRFKWEADPLKQVACSEN